MLRLLQPLLLDTYFVVWKSRLSGPKKNSNQRGPCCNTIRDLWNVLLVVVVMGGAVSLSLSLYNYKKEEEGTLRLPSVI